ncbi:LANO_0E11936g1_1 [Lachancea nothofagi CBS 11611]|uniref:LANO_0E11936g1_1 n=1 Tax=Lachancea nothofagi CBS 11611 TaxID=1266666 RepID=A0A1G4JXR3_9SACH|nr:LANO_0E11936g1_1 [Lachancea nothofagi CBS 11611]
MPLGSRDTETPDELHLRSIRAAEDDIAEELDDISELVQNLQDRSRNSQGQLRSRSSTIDSTGPGLDVTGHSNQRGQQYEELQNRGGARVQRRLQQDRNLRWPPGVQRRRYLRLFLRNLLLLDHLLMMILFPFSVYNVLKILLTEVTFSDNDFIAEIANYCRYSNVLSEDGKSVVFFKSGFGLLGKFHNIIVYNSAPMVRWASTKATIGPWIIKIYASAIKMTTVLLYTAYGVGTSTYVCFATFFFTLCLLMTGFRRYKGIVRIMGHLYRTTVGVF